MIRPHNASINHSILYPNNHVGAVAVTPECEPPCDGGCDICSSNPIAQAIYLHHIQVSVLTGRLDPLVSILSVFNVSTPLKISLVFIDCGFTKFITCFLNDEHSHSGEEGMLESESMYAKHPLLAPVTSLSKDKLPVL